MTTFYGPGPKHAPSSALPPWLIAFTVECFSTFWRKGTQCHSNNCFSRDEGGRKFCVLALQECFPSQWQNCSTKRKTAPYSHGPQTQWEPNASSIALHCYCSITKGIASTVVILSLAEWQLGLYLWPACYPCHRVPIVKINDWSCGLNSAADSVVKVSYNTVLYKTSASF